MLRTTLLSSLLLVSACNSDISLYQLNTPRLEPTVFFNGKMCAWGTVHDFSGDVTRRFIADISARSTDTSFVLDELFLFDDGSTQTRVWTFIKQGDSWSGTADDVKGTAYAHISGNMMSLEYQLEIKLDNDTITVAMDDKLHLIDENNMMGKTEMRKFGIPVGEINLLMQKQQLSGRCDIKVDASI